MICNDSSQIKAHLFILLNTVEYFAQTHRNTCSYQGIINWPFPSSKNSHFKTRLSAKPFYEKEFYSHESKKDHFHINGLDLSLVLKQRLEANGSLVL